MCTKYILNFDLLETNFFFVLIIDIQVISLFPFWLGGYDPPLSTDPNMSMHRDDNGKQIPDFRGNMNVVI